MASSHHHSRKNTPACQRERDGRCKRYLLPKNTLIDNYSPVGTEEKSDKAMESVYVRLALSIIG